MRSVIIGERSHVARGQTLAMAPTAFLHAFAKPSADRFITIVRGEGAAVFDDQGRRYVDALASLWYCNIGHGRIEMADAIAAQVRTLAGYHTFDIFTNEPAERLAASIAERAPIDGARVFFTNSGSEAVDTAIKLARLRSILSGHPDKQLVLARRDAYHGTTYGGMTAQGLPLNREGFGPLVPDVVHIDRDDPSDAEAVFREHGHRVAAVVAEPVLGAGGVFPPRPGYLDALRALCDEHDALLVLDEVITGFGRLGSWFGAEHYGVRPDLVTFAKAVTSGYLPLGGVVVGRAVRDAIEADPEYVLRTGFTYSGHPTTCVAALTNLEILEREHLLGRAGSIGERLAHGFGELVRAGSLAEVRGDGAIWGVGLVPETSALAVRDGLLRRGVIARPIGTHTIAFCPPLVIGAADQDRCVEALGESVREVAVGARG
jgi:putrescine---pyruvate transaminase